MRKTGRVMRYQLFSGMVSSMLQPGETCENVNSYIRNKFSYMQCLNTATPSILPGNTKRVIVSTGTSTYPAASKYFK